MEWVYKRGNVKINLKRFIPFVAAMLFLISSMVFYLTTGAKKSTATAVKTTAAASNNGKVDTVRLSFVGDLLMHTAERKSGFNEANNSYDFNYFFKDVKGFFTGKDFIIGNLETSISKETADKYYSGYPIFKNPPEFIEAIKNAGINALVTSNNHVLDAGEKGLLKTMEWIEKYNLPYTGTYKTAEDRQAKPVMFLEKNNMKVAVMNYTEFTNAAITKSPFMANYINLDQIRRDIEFAKTNRADAIIVWLHFGNEYERQPSEKQKKITDEIFKMGADIVIGSHPHVIQPMESKVVDGRKVFVAYAIGNFISNQYWRYSTDGMILNIDLEKKDGKVNFKNVNYIPTAVVREYNGPQTQNEPAVKPNEKSSDFITGAVSKGMLKGPEVKFRVVPVGQAIYDYENKLDKNLNDKDYIRLKTTWDDTTGLVGEGEDYKVYRDKKTWNFPLGQKQAVQPKPVEPFKPKADVKPKTDVKTDKAKTTAKPKTDVKQPAVKTTTTTKGATTTQKDTPKPAPKVPNEIQIIE